MSNLKITDLTASDVIRSGNVLEVVQFPATVATSLKLSADNFIPNGLLAPAASNALDDEFTNAQTLPGGTSAQWSWDNQGGASVTMVNRILQILAPTSSSNQHRCLKQTLPSTPWEFETKVYLCGKNGTNYSFAGLAILESGTGKRTTFYIGHDSNDVIEVFHWTTYSALHDTVVTDSWLSKHAYLKIGNDGTNMYFQYSEDGLTWFQVYSEANNTWMASPDGVALIVNNINTTYTCQGAFSFFRRTI